MTTYKRCRCEAPLPKKTERGAPAPNKRPRPYQGKTLTKTAQVRMLGNSVCPPVAQAMALANVPELAEVEGVA